jgi:hypothetical protein
MNRGDGKVKLNEAGSNDEKMSDIMQNIGFPV